MSIHWRDTTVAPGATHHLHQGRPLYDARFDEVLKFHGPGLAPVQDTSGGYHIDLSGQPAYARRFQRTFGYYEGVAAVAGEDGWRHINPAGQDVYAARWSWCGNFQGGRCTVRSAEGRYGHIAPDGAVVGGVQWHYAGDFRDGIAVVQAQDGRHTHVDHDGQLLHAVWFEDLDVFHKGYARARDAAGWTHVDGRGQAVYDRRFANVEPFYNGQARVERFDGGLEVIDEAGRALVELRPARRDPLHQVSAELVSFWRCEAVFAAVELGVFDSLPITSPPSRLRRLLAALGELGLVQRDGERWVASPAGALLQTDHPRSLAAAARYWSRDGRQGWRMLQEAVSDPSWVPRDPFVAVSNDPDAVASFHAALQPYAENDYADLGSVIDEEQGVVIDAGGATGALAKLLLHAWPRLRALVLDRPEVAALGQIPADLNKRLEFIGGDLFQPWPCRGDAVVLARVLHDWSDEQCVTLLRHAREALPLGGRLYVVELVRRAEGFDAALLSLHLMVSTGGMERTADQYEQLLSEGGFRLMEVRASKGISSVLVAEAT